MTETKENQDAVKSAGHEKTQLKETHPKVDPKPIAEAVAPEPAFILKPITPDQNKELRAMYPDIEAEEITGKELESYQKMFAEKAWKFISAVKWEYHKALMIIGVVSEGERGLRTRYYRWFKQP